MRRCGAGAGSTHVCTGTPRTSPRPPWSFQLDRPCTRSSTWRCCRCRPHTLACARAGRGGARGGEAHADAMERLCERGAGGRGACSMLRHRGRPGALTGAAAGAVVAVRACSTGAGAAGPCFFPPRDAPRRALCMSAPPATVARHTAPCHAQTTTIIMQSSRAILAAARCRSTPGTAIARAWAAARCVVSGS